MAYKIQRDANHSGRPDTGIYYAKFSHYYSYEANYVLEDLDPTMWEVVVFPNDLEIRPTKETKTMLDEREIIISFWASCLKQALLDDLRCGPAPFLVDSNGEHVRLYDDVSFTPSTNQIIVAGSTPKQKR